MSGRKVSIWTPTEELALTRKKLTSSKVIGGKKEVKNKDLGQLIDLVAILIILFKRYKARNECGAERESVGGGEEGRSGIRRQ